MSGLHDLCAHCGGQHPTAAHSDPEIARAVKRTHEARGEYTEAALWAGVVRKLARARPADEPPSREQECGDFGDGELPF